MITTREECNEFTRGLLQLPDVIYIRRYVLYEAIDLRTFNSLYLYCTWLCIRLEYFEVTYVRYKVTYPVQWIS